MIDDNRTIKILISHGLISYIKIMIDRFEKGDEELYATISEITRAINEYAMYCQTGRGHK